jgi:hypothetical protein
MKSCKSFIILQYVHMPIKYSYLINIFFLNSKVFGLGLLNIHK